jgi:predicted DNA-binding helix-hairpin-helix protein
MNSYTVPDTFTKLTKMGDVTFFEPAGDAPQAEQSRPLRPDKGSDSVQRFQARSLSDCISSVSTPTGTKPILKTMLTTACERNCYYCPFRAGRSKTPRINFTPDELAKGFDTLQRARQVDGLFLSSGIIKGSVTTQDRLLDTVEIIRRRYGYRGYVHLKVMPGAEYDQLYRAMQLADRVSVNLEGATPERLSALAPKKDFDGELLRMLREAEQIRRDHPHERLAKTVTQFVVGAVGDTDLELLSTSEKLYRTAGLTRAYYSAFGPVIQTPFENLPAVAGIREHRLYQASFLLRDYAWELEDLSFEGIGNLQLDVDPKQAWADRHLRHTPIEIMTAERAALMRVPGIGPESADRIIAARKRGSLRDISMLKSIGIRGVERLAPYITLDGYVPLTQGRLF